ncbi:helix-turn-helix domain-containing protein [Lacticaseibacillus porcinae]|uniref:helix-turn-helix domain-containing protein n=1 Tax=Lacticaseibacillus porcinae TaxID=1123687 RepID=UPI000F79E5B2|nr:RodZ domain-containing protein [Lacticaseibacillus porcinae]
MDEIGQKLRTARIEKGYTLDDLQQITKIQKRYLIAIEEGNFDALPGDFYVRAFIKQYADTVGIDSDALLTQFQQDIPDTQPQEYVEQSVESQSRKTRAVADKPVNKLRRYLPQIVIAVIAVLIIGVAYVVTFKSSQSNKQAIPDTASSVTVSSKKKSSSVKKSSSKSSSASEKSSSDKSTSSSKKAKKSSSSKASDKLSVAVAAEANSAQAVTVKNWPTTANTITVGASKSAAWVEVLINGTASWQGTLSAGAEHTVDLPAGTTSFAVKSGNATTTTIKLNKTNVDISNGTSFVRTINFTTESAGN